MPAALLSFPRVRAIARGAAITVSVVMVASCGRDNKTDVAKPPVEVTVITTAGRDVAVAPVYVAQTQSSQAVNIQARVSGFLDKRVYREGSVVKKGQVLFQMDQKPFQTQVDAQNAALQRNQAALQVAKANLDRTKPLTAQNALSQKDLDDAQGQYEQAAAAVEQGKAQLEEAKLNLSYTTITTPVTGVSSYAAVADGTYLNPQNSQLTTVSVLTPMWINFSVSENEMERIRDQVKKGQLKLPDGGQFIVEIEMVDGSLFPFKGRITFADPSYNSATGTFLLRATVDNPEGVLRPNQYVRTRLIGATLPNAITVPQRAVQNSAKGHFVWVVSKDNKAELRPVDVGDWNGDDWVISSGLNSGENVVVDGGVRLAAGADVKATPYKATPVAARTGPTMATAIAGASVLFAPGNATLDATAMNAVRAHAASVMGIGTVITITGYADRTGNAQANVDLAKRRALAVRDALVAQGVNAERIRLLAPVTVTGSGSDQEARRVDIAVGK